MAKLVKVILTAAFDPGSDEPMLKGSVLIAGKGRVRELTQREVKVPDIDLDDDPANRRIFVRIPERAATFIPYEHVWRAEVAEEAKPLAVAGKARR